MFKGSKLTFKGSKLTFKGSKLLTLREDKTYPHQFISITLLELVSTTVEVRTQWMWRFSTKTIVSTNSSSSCFSSNSSALTPLYLLPYYRTSLAGLLSPPKCNNLFRVDTSLRVPPIDTPLSWWVNGISGQMNILTKSPFHVGHGNAIYYGIGCHIE